MSMRRLLGLLVIPLLTILPVATVSAQPVDPETLVRQFADAINRGDVGAAVALFTEDGSFQGSSACGAMPCVGRAALQVEFQRQVAENTNLTVASVQVSGNTARSRVEVRSDPIRSAGVDRIIILATGEVRDGRFVRVTGIPDASDPQTARLLALQAGQPPAQVPVQLPRLPRTGDGGGEVVEEEALPVGEHPS